MMEVQNEKGKPRGLILKEARIVQDISLDSVQDATKIPLDILKAIEEGYTVRTLSPFYLKAFMKKYAQFLDVDVNEIVDSYHQEELPDPIQTIREEEEQQIQSRLGRVLTRERQQFIVKIGLVVVALFLVTKVIGCINQKMADRPAKTARPASREVTVRNVTPPPTQKEVEKSKPAVPAARPQTTVVQTASAKPTVSRHLNKNVNLVVTAKKGSWLQVKVDGNLVFQSTLRKGVSETWQADKQIEISGNNIHQLEYEVNGKMLGTLSRNDRRARRVIITKDGLSVKK